VLQANGSFEKKDRRGVMALDAQEMFTQDTLVQQNNQMKQEQLTATKQRFEPLNNPFISEEYGGEE